MARRFEPEVLVAAAGAVCIASSSTLVRLADTTPATASAFRCLLSVPLLALLAWRDTGAMALLLAVHLGTVLALFLTLPYGKFAHAVYRSAALLKWAIERRQPNRLQLGSD